MWVQDNELHDFSEIELMNAARGMRDASLARYVATAWHGVSDAAVRLLHMGQLQKHGHPRTH